VDLDHFVQPGEEFCVDFVSEPLPTVPVGTVLRVIAEIEFFGHPGRAEFNVVRSTQATVKVS